MPFRFSYFCELLDSLERLQRRQVPLLPKDLGPAINEACSRWFASHKDSLNAHTTDDKAVMAMLRPENQTDRVYGLDVDSLELTLARIFGLSRMRRDILQRWKREPANGDIGICLMEVMQELKRNAIVAIKAPVTVEDIDQTLLRIASNNPASSSEVQSLATTWPYVDYIDLLGGLYSRMPPREAKWLTRLILKSLAPVKVPKDIGAGATRSIYPTCLAVEIKLPTSSAPPLRREGSGITKGVPDITRVQLATPPSSSLVSHLRQTVHSPALIDSARNSAALTSSIARRIVVTASSRGHSTPKPFQTTLDLVSLPSTNQTANNSRTRTVGVLRPSSAHSTSPSISVTMDMTVASYVPDSTPARSILGPLATNSLTSSRMGSQSSATQGQRPSHLIHIGSGTCKLVPPTCTITKYIFVLAPCIAKMPYVTEDLLPRHGCSYVLSLSALLHPSLPRRCPKTQERYNKIVLVEPNRPTQTSAFLDRIRKMELSRNGKRVQLKVYDWRLLECVGKIEQGRGQRPEPWKRYWMDDV